jgi:hypothetical protein
MIMDSSLPFTFIRPRDTSRRAEVEGVPSKFWWASRVGRRGTSAYPRACVALRFWRSKKVSADELWRYLIACPVNGYRSTRRDDRDVSHPVSAEPAGE